MSVAVAAVCWSRLSRWATPTTFVSLGPQREKVVARLGCRLEDLDNTLIAVDADAIAVVDLLGRVLRADDGGNAELATEHGRVGRHPAGVCHQARDIGEEHHPSGICHVADQHVTGTDLVE